MDFSTEMAACAADIEAALDRLLSSANRITRAAPVER